jgi:two-component system response regulator
MSSDPERFEEQHASNESVADILLVEDDAIHARLTLQALNRCGLGQRVEHVTDGAEALDYMESMGLFASKPGRRPKLILLDLGLQKIGGMQVLRQLKSNELTRNIPIVVLTSSILAIELMESYKLGVNSYVIKPSELKRFQEVVAGIGHYWLTVNEPPLA